MLIVHWTVTKVVFIILYYNPFLVYINAFLKCSKQNIFNKDILNWWFLLFEKFNVIHLQTFIKGVFALKTWKNMLNLIL